jgi:hypothetical protein
VLNGSYKKIKTKKKLMELNNVSRLSPVSCYTLNIEEYSGLEVAMLQRKLQENLIGKLYFWGKIFGSTQDYLIVHNINPYDEFPEKKYYFWFKISYVNLKSSFAIINFTSC